MVVHECVLASEIDGETGNSQLSPSHKRNQGFLLAVGVAALGKE